MNKENFCQYLEEVAAELRAFSSTKEYIFDVCRSLIDHTINFEKQELEENRIRAVENDTSRPSIMLHDYTETDG